MSDVLLARAKEIIDDIFYVTVAAVSKNIRDNENVFLVIYDSTAPEGAGGGDQHMMFDNMLMPSTMEVGINY